ncbi:hypothetical protein [Runella sp.]|uniref:hypothetical protein n=1 Tax=Runella sp. TaxID=1960881 RepID=UPI003D0F9C50
MLSCAWLFYRQFWIFSNAVAWGGWLVAGAPINNEVWLMFAPLFWLKLASYAVIWYLMQAFSKHTYLFYQNLGYAVSRLFVGAFLMDMLLFFGALALIKFLFSL